MKYMEAAIAVLSEPGERLTTSEIMERIISASDLGRRRDLRYRQRCTARVMLIRSMVASGPQERTGQREARLAGRSLGEGPRTHAQLSELMTIYQLALQPLPGPDVVTIWSDLNHQTLPKEMRRVYGLAT